MSVLSRACGLTLAAKRPIPGLVSLPVGRIVDVRIVLGALPPGLDSPPVGADDALPAPADNGSGKPRRVTWDAGREAGYEIAYDDGTRFVTDASGDRVWATWRAPLTLEDTAVYLLGPVLALVLRLRGVTCLHADADGGGALVIAGPSGAGKSTTAAVFHALGHDVMADDLLALEEGVDAILAHPGSARLRLWPDAAGMVYGPRRQLPRLTPNWNKRYLDLGDRTGRGHAPRGVSAVYLLDERSDDPAAPYVAPLSASAALLHLLANVRGDVYPNRRSRRRDFQRLGRLAREAPVRRVVPSTDPLRLARLCDVILQDHERISDGAGDRERRACTI